MNVRRVAATLAGAIVVSIAPSAQAAAPVAPYRADDYGNGGFHDILPPGANGRANGLELAAFLTAGQRPPHSDDQRDMYANLVKATPGLSAADLGKFFKDSSFGVRQGDVESTIAPRDDVTIVRDKGFGVPHIYATTRAGALFGEGYAAATDRLFFIDVLRHLGRAELSSFAGGSPGNRAMDQEQWQVAPYTEADLQRQIDQGDDLYGADGVQGQEDVTNYVAGINQYISEARLDPTKMPGEYVAINRPQGPDDWKATDIIATASLVGGIFGKGGGHELEMAQFLQHMQDRFGAKVGRKLWYQMAAFDDPDAPTTVKQGSFPYQRPSAKPAKGSEVLPDAGSLKGEPTVVAGADSGASGAPSGAGTSTGVGPIDTVLGTAGGALPGNLPSGLPGGLVAVPKSNSNALVISAARSKSGHPIAVFGPQVGYFNPEILMEQDVHAPTIDARGAAFPGVNLYVQLGRGRDYAWSATSAGQDIIDTFVLPTCQDDMHYLFRGECLPVEVLERSNSWTPNAADQTPPGSQTLRALRTKLGIVRARGTVRGQPVLFTTLRSTYFHEVDSARGFSDFNDPNKVHDPKSFQAAASKIGYTFNWLYVDDKDTAYFNSGNNPVRPAGATGQLPMTEANTWKGYNADLNTAQYTPPAQHPQVVDQDWMTSWNNRQAAGYAGADTNLFSSVYRSQMLDQEISARLTGGRKLTLPGLVDAMEEAGSTDLRGEQVLPWALKVLGTPKDPALRSAVATLRSWVANGAHRRDKNGDGTYDQADAVRIMDAWWPLWLKAQFEPVLGKTLFETLPHQQDNAPNNHGDHLGSAYQEGWYGYAKKDLETLLHVKVAQPYAKAFCGKGNLKKCRRALSSSLAAAIKVPAAQLYSGDATCQKAKRDGDQTCWDAVSFRPLGGVTQPLIPWINRPTYQQTVEITGHRLSNPAPRRGGGGAGGPGGSGSDEQLGPQPGDQRDQRDRGQEAGEDARGRVDPAARAPALLGGQQVGLQQHVPRGVDPRARDEHVARPGGQHVGDVEAAGAAQHRRDALLEQQALDELGLGLVARAGDLDELALGELRLDLARALVGLGDRLVDAEGAGVDERHAAVAAEALIERMGPGAGRAGEGLRLSHPPRPRPA
jgi:acyl-homoserine lactone acylase PvdQ